MCRSFPVSGTVCYLECRHGFLGNGGINVMSCGKDGKWSSDVSSVLKCLGTLFSSPVIVFSYRLNSRRV